MASVYNDIQYNTLIPQTGTYSEQVAIMLQKYYTIATKTHEGWLGYSPTPFAPSSYQKAIMVVRDIHESILADYKRINLQYEFSKEILNSSILDSEGRVEYSVAGTKQA